MIAINPVITTNAAGTFHVTLDGLMQGMAMDDPAVRYQLTGGQLAPTETLPMFGGVPITEFIPPASVPGALVQDSSLQTWVARATTAAGITGFSVFNQNHAMINSPQSPVPQADVGMLVNLYRVGSLARIAFAMDPAFPLPPAAPGVPIMPWAALNFDPVNQWITAAAGLALPAGTKVIGYNIGNSMTVVYNATTGFATWNRNGNAILLQI